MSTTVFIPRVWKGTPAGGFYFKISATLLTARANALCRHASVEDETSSQVERGLSVGLQTAQRRQRSTRKRRGEEAG